MLWYLEEFISISKMPGWVGWDGDGMGREGMGREGMSWDGSGVGAGYHVEKYEKQNVFYQQFTPGHHCGSLLASAGQLVAHWGLLFVFLFVTWGVLVPSGAKAPKRYEKLENMGAGRDVFLVYLSADKH